MSLPGPTAAPPCPVCLQPASRPFARTGQRRYWRCTLCEATFLDPPQQPDAATERAEYALHCNAIDDPGYRRWLSALSEPLLERLPPDSCGLDYGCGPGPALAAMLRAAGHRVALYDPLFQPEVRVLGQRYDFVTCTEVAEHFHQPAREFERLDALLRPGGWLGLMTGFLGDGVDFERWHYRRDPTHVLFYRPATFAWLARRHAWRCEIPRPNVVLMQKAD